MLKYIFLKRWVDLFPQHRTQVTIKAHSAVCFEIASYHPCTNRSLIPSLLQLKAKPFTLFDIFHCHPPPMIMVTIAALSNMDDNQNDKKK